MLSTLHIQLLGDFRLVHGNTSIAITSVRLQALLAYLALHHDAPQHRHHIAFLFWPDSTESQARTNLRYLLHQLRSLLPDIDHYLDMKTQTLQWQSDTSFTLDVARFEGAVQRAAEAEQAGDQRILQHALAEAVTLYRGDLVPSCYDDWIAPEREQLRARFLCVLEQLIPLLEDQRDYRSAIRYAQRLLRHDPLHEDTYLRLMRLHTLNGDRAGAVRVYHTCVTTLQQKLSVEPLPATRAAYERLLHLESSPATPQTTLLPLVGRQREWQQLLAIWCQTVQGGPHVALLVGEAGIGKSRLAEELLTWVGQQGFTTAASRCYAAADRLAYAPVTEWLRSAGMRTTLHNLDALWLTEVARLLPELLVECSDLPHPEPMTEGWQRQRLFEALARALRTAKSPLLVLDDLQWCDRDTLEWLHYLLHADPQARVLIVCSIRSEELEEHPSLASLLWQLRQGRRFTEIELAPLSAEETARLATHISGSPVDAERAADLYRETEGNPLFVVEMVRANLGRGADERAARDNQSIAAPHLAPLPPRIQAVIESRLAQLSPLAHTLATLAAIIGRKFTFDVLAQASDGDERRVVEGLDELQQRHIIREQGPAWYDFSHDKIRDVAYAQVSNARRRLLHRRVAQALEQVYATNLDDVSGQVAMHYERAGLVALAISFYQRAAAVAQRIYANQDAIDLLRNALALLRTLPKIPERDESELALQTALGVPLVITKGFGHPDVEKVYARAWELCQQDRDTPLLYPVMHGLWNCYLVRADYRKAYELAGKLLMLSENQCDPVKLVTAHRAMGTSLFLLGELTQAQDHLACGMTHYNRQHHGIHAFRYGHDSGVGCLRYGAWILWLLGYPDQAQHQIQQAVALADQLGHPFSQAAALLFQAILHQLCRDTAPARDLQMPWSVLPPITSLPCMQRVARYCPVGHECGKGRWKAALISSFRGLRPTRLLERDCSCHISSPCWQKYMTALGRRARGLRR